MNNFIENYLTWKYLGEVSGNALFQDFLLYFAIFVTVLPIIVKIILKIRGRSVAYRKFDRLWFWSYFSLGLTGLFLSFSVDQGLPLLGSRFVVYLWLVSLGLFTIYLFWHYRTVTTRDVLHFHEKKRKEKYLK